MTARYDLVVIGSGPAGQKAAIQAAKAGRTVLVLEEDACVGGACVHYGTIPSKTLRETAVALLAFRRKSAGLIPLQIPPDLRLMSLLARKERVVEVHERCVRDQLSRNGIERWHGRARFTSPHELEVCFPSRERRAAWGESVVIATGSRPRNPENIPIDHENVLDSDSILSLAYLPKSLTVLGGGVIASEYASIFAALGVRVTMIDRADRPLMFLDPEVVERFTTSFERSGGRFLGGRTVLSVASDDFTGVTVSLDDGSTVSAEKLLCALGRIANVEALHIEAAGLTANARGLLTVDAVGRTAVPHIFAAGDVIGPPSLASAAMDQGRRVACEIVGLAGHEAVSTIPAGVYTIPEIASVGLSEAQAVETFGGALVGRARFEEIARGQIAGIEDGLLKLVADQRGERVLGVQIVGEGAAELIHLGQLALIGRLGIETFVDQNLQLPHARGGVSSGRVRGPQAARRAGRERRAASGRASVGAPVSASPSARSCGWRPRPRPEAVTVTVTVTVTQHGHGTPKIGARATDHGASPGRIERAIRAPCSASRVRGPGSGVGAG